MRAALQLALALLPAISAMALAQSYPARPITIVVPFAAGGPVDADTRRYAAK
jgi:tripartite-type tricarboxylate transporter receptor subunit TctC